MGWRFIFAVAIFATAPAVASAQSVLEVLAGVKFCRTLKDDAQRLKCFDNLFVQADAPAAPDKPEVEASWKITEDKSPVDDSPWVTGVLPTKDAKAALFLRCKENKTDAFFTREASYVGSQDRIKVIVRIGSTAPITTSWSPSTNGTAVFAPSPIQFIRALPDGERLFIRAHGYGGRTMEGQFDLGAVSAVRDKIAAACKWPK
jgi:hypothetical protein